MIRSLHWKASAPAIVVASTLLVSTIVAVFYTGRLQSLTAGIVAENVTSLRAAEELELSLRDIRSTLNQYATTGNRQLLASLPQQEDYFAKWMAQGERVASAPEEKEMFANIKRGFATLSRETSELSREQDPTKSQQAAKRLAEDCVSAMIPYCHASLEFNEKSIEQTAERHLALSSRLLWVLIVAGLVIPLAGVFLGYLLSINISRDLARSREDLLKADQLAAIGKLAAGMAHELSNPLTSILMMVQTSESEDVEELRIIEDEVRRMERTIQACLDFAKPAKPCSSLVDFRTVIDSAKRLVDARIRRQQVEISVQTSDEPLYVMADSQHLHQLVLNLILNAIDSVGLGGTMGIIADETDGQVELIVWDHGPGIRVDLLPRIFEPFVSTKENGTGLGLSICHRIVEAHGGTITAENQPGHGAVFRVKLKRYGTTDHADATGHRRRTEHPSLLSTSVP